MECCIIKLSVGIATIVFGLIFGWVLDPYKASYNIADAEFAITQLAMSTMRVEVGKLTLDKTFEEREQMNANIVSAINQTVANWGLNCLRYEIRTCYPLPFLLRLIIIICLQVISHHLQEQWRLWNCKW